MNYEIEGKYFKDKVEIALFLNKHEISPLMKKDKLLFENFNDYINSLIILRKHNKIDKKIYDEKLREAYKFVYDRKISKELKKEKYDISFEDKKAIISCEDKKLIISKEDESFEAHYFVSAIDSHEDRKHLDAREIPFLIKKDSPIYSVFDRLFLFLNKNKDNNSYILSESNDIRENHIKISKNDDNEYLFTVVKMRKDKKLSNEKEAVIDLGNVYTNNNWMKIDYIYGNIEMKSKYKKYGKR